MARIFISHSSENNDAAIQFGHWLTESGFDDYFLDTHQSKGLLPGQRWQEALKAAANRCEAVVVLISPAWLNSTWCKAELMFAKGYGKMIFGVIIESTPIESLPFELTAEWQLADWVAQPEEGKAKLKAGLTKAGLDPSTFLWPPPSEPNRDPYRGLQALEEMDAAIMFGREADTVRGLDELRQINDRGDQRFLAILGASGAGKSSFLRAGLWPRLRRDSRNFFPLPIIRPERSPLLGQSGLAACLESALASVGISETRGAIADKIKTLGPLGLATYIERIEAGLRSDANSDSRSPTLVLAIDQCEELFYGNTPNKDERDLVLTSLAALLGAQSTEHLTNFPAASQRLICVATIRSDTYELLQLDPIFVGVRRRTFDLSPIHPGSYQSIIEGPAHRATEGGKRLEIDPKLTESLLKDTVGKDALPLLGFTLQRLYVQYGADGDLLLSEYEQMGGIQGSIAAAVDEAIEDAESNGLDSSADSNELLRETFLPSLVKIGGRDEPPLRQIADLQDLPAAARPLIDAFVERRLLRLDLRDGSKIVEVAHEALLRQWRQLSAWLDDERETLGVLGNVLAASREYEIRHDSGDEAAAWLVHMGKRLELAESLLIENRYQKALGQEGKNYLACCRELQNQAEQNDLLQVKEAKSRSRRKITWRLILAAGIAVFFSALVKHHFAYSSRGIAQTSSDGSKIVTISGNITTLWQSEAGDQWQKLNLEGHTNRVNAVVVLLNGSRVATVADDHTVRIWTIEPDQTISSSVLEGHSEWVTHIVASQAGDLIATVDSDSFLRVWSQEENNGWRSNELPIPNKPILSIDMTNSGQRFVVGLDYDNAIVWTVDQAGLWSNVELSGHTDSVRAVTISDDGKTIVTGSDDYTARIWQEVGINNWKFLSLVGHSDYIRSVHLSSNKQRVVTTSDDNTARVWSLGTDNYMQSAALIGHTKNVRYADFASDESRIVTGSDDGTVRVWRRGNRNWVSEILDVLAGGVGFVAFMDDDQRIFVAESNGKAHVWEALSPTGWQRIEFAPGCSTLPCF